MSNDLSAWRKTLQKEQNNLRVWPIVNVPKVTVDDILEAIEKYKETKNANDKRLCNSHGIPERNIRTP